MSIEANQQYFNSCLETVKSLYDNQLYNDCAEYLKKLSFFAWLNFSGYYKNSSLELYLNLLGKHISPFVNEKLKEKKDYFSVLHICSQVYKTGGHSKLLYNWIKNDQKSHHALLSIRQPIDELREVSESYLEKDNQLDLLSVNAENLLKSSQLLREVLYNNYDLIVLHIHPDEVVTNIALSDTNIPTPVSYLNHADHVYWNGVTISDIIIQIRESNISFDSERRDITCKQVFLPIPITEQGSTSIDEHSASINILTTGTYYKYLPNEKYDFLKEAELIVTRHPHVLIHIVGINEQSEYAQKHQHPQLIFHGTISPEELQSLEQKTDIYLEGFPTPSFTALLQPAMKGIPFVLHYQPLELFKLFVENDSDCIVYPKSVQDWHLLVDRLISNKSEREAYAQKQYNIIRNNFHIDSWRTKLNELYDLVNLTTHKIHDLKEDKSWEGENEKFLVTTHKYTIQHYLHTENLPLADKVKVIKKASLKNDNVSYLGKKALLNYLSKNKLKKIYTNITPIKNPRSKK